MRVGKVPVGQSRAYVWNGTDWVEYPARLVADQMSMPDELPLHISVPVAFDGTNWDRLRTHMYATLSGITSTGPTAAYDSVSGVIDHTWVVIINGTSTGTHCRLQGSLDGTNWFDLDDYTNSESWMRHVVNKPVRYVRVYVDSLGGADSVDVQYYAMR